MKINKKLSIIFFIVSVFSACSDFSNTKKNRDISDSEEIKIGIVYPVEQIDKEMHFRKGYELALYQINQSGGILGKRISAEIRDDNGYVHRAMQIAETFKNGGRTAVIGHWGTNVCYYVVDVYEKNEVVMLTPAATGMNLFEYEYKYLFRMTPNNQIFAQELANYSANMGHRKIAIFYDDDDYGSDFANAMETELNKVNIYVIDRVSSITSNNIGNIDRRWNAFGCDGVYFAAYIDNFIEPIKLIRQVNPSIPIFGADNFDSYLFTDELAGYTNNIYKAIYDNSNISHEFVELFIRMYEHEPDMSAVTGYDSVFLLKDAIETMNSTDASAIADYLSTLKDYKTVSGVLSYNAHTQEFEGFEVKIIKVSNARD